MDQDLDFKRALIKNPESERWITAKKILRDAYLFKDRSSPLLEWAVPENIPTIPRAAPLNSEAMGVEHFRISEGKGGGGGLKCRCHPW